MERDTNRKRSKQRRRVSRTNTPGLLFHAETPQTNESSPITLAPELAPNQPSDPQYPRFQPKGARGFP